MVKDNPDNSNEEFARIEPAAISLTTFSSQDPAANKRAPLKSSPLVWLGLGVLLSAVVGVIFLLPGWVETSGSEKAVPVSTMAPAPALAHKPVIKDKISPWEKAQESRQRKETQEILSQMLEAQKVLAEKGVELWADEDYAEAMQLAATGDERYNERDFTTSRVEYEKALTIFSRLVEEMDEVFEATMKTGNQALVDGNSQIALEAFELALAIDAIDRTAITGRERAENLDAVLTLMDQGDELLEKEQLDEARQAYQQVVALDGHFDMARQQIEITDKKILDRKFNRHMSTGFAAMETKHFTQAQQAFNQALKLKPRAAEARTALEQTRHKLTTININSLLADARELEKQEHWHEALEKYRAALALDNSLAEAQQGRQLASLRDKLHNRLEQILAQPARLYDQKVYTETVDFRKKLNALSNPGPVLSKQLMSLGKILHKANTPVEVNLQSDNLTLVTLRKVGELGFFLEKTLSVRPGSYIVVGIREGYRDVRIEFMVDPDKPLHAITVQTAEKIALGK